MRLYRSNLSDKTADGILTHLGSVRVSAYRLHTMFCAANLRGIDEDGTIMRFNHFKEPIGEEMPQEALRAFIEFNACANITEYDADIQRPLRLNDCWLDDPIGSGGMDIFEGNRDISQAQREELKELFSPFTGIIYPQDVMLVAMFGILKQMTKEWEKNGIYTRELAKRKERCLAVGEDFGKAALWESVWVGMTMKLRNWALKNNFDAFVYTNIQEGTKDNPEDSYVTLKNGQIKPTGRSMSFQADKYLNAVGSEFKSWLRENAAKAEDNKLYDIFWVRRDPQSFWAFTA